MYSKTKAAVAQAQGMAGPATPARVGRRRRVLRWLLLLLILVPVGVGGYAALLVYRFQHAIYHPLPTPVAILAAAQQPTITSSPPPTATSMALAPTTAAIPATGPTSQPTLTNTTLAPADTATANPPTATATSVPAAGRTNILILGTDKRTELQQQAARSDTLIIASLDQQAQSAGLLSVPRDLRVPVPGYGAQKINAAYFYGEYYGLPGGGPALALTTVSQYFNTPIPYYLEINFDGFQKVIDSVGGIDVNVPQVIDDPLYPGANNSYIHVHFDSGCQHMDGVRALQYARTRHSDSDFGRSVRQQQVIKAALASALRIDALPRLPDLLSQMGDSIATNIPPDLQLQLASFGASLGGGGLYTTQIDGALVSAIPGSSDLQLNRTKAQPLLDHFFGRSATASPTAAPTTSITPAAPSVAVACSAS